MFVWNVTTPQCEVLLYIELYLQKAVNPAEKGVSFGKPKGKPTNVEPKTLFKSGLQQSCTVYEVLNDVQILLSTL